MTRFSTAWSIPDALHGCDFCTRAFRTVAGLRTHALRVHKAAIEDGPKCKRCGDTGWLDGDPVRGISDDPCGCDENWEE